jgi:phage repressor protein C with HTH and peptisase S24 domain
MVLRRTGRETMGQLDESFWNDRDVVRAGSDKSAFVERLHTILAHWPSADRLAREMKVSPSAFRKWLKGEAEPSRERLVALARVAGVGVAWLAEGEGSEPVFEAVPGNRRKTAAGASDGRLNWAEFVLLPKRPEAAAAGAETPVAPTGNEYLALRQDWVRSVCGVEPENLRLELAVGESMTPTIRDGSIMLIDTSETTVRSFGIYVLEINGERLVKRVQRKHDASLVLISDNKTYQPDVVPTTEATKVTVLGRVVWAGGAI